MAYTALRDMQERNQERFGEKVGPIQPELHGKPEAYDLKSTAMRFLHNRCEKLRFDPEKEAQEKDGHYLGSGLKPNQIPYNMQMDIDRLCLERELEKFIDSGTSDDAFNVYYCYLEMFFGHFGKTRKMTELLSEYESNGGSLLMKHRDHYAHSVYVFALGLAIYEANDAFREAFRNFYGLTDDKGHSDEEAAHVFLEYWGLTALFHDIGYPFELPFEQTIAYFEANGLKRGQGILYMAYRDMEHMTKLPEKVKEYFASLFGKDFETSNDLLAWSVSRRLGSAYGIQEEEFAKKVAAKPGHPEEFSYYMDHAWFSASRLLQELLLTFGAENMNEKHLDVLSAILLHNSLFKFAIAFYKDKEKHKDPLKMELHPLAYLLMICDELQCWDRTPYGRTSRREMHPISVGFDFGNGGIRAEYFYDDEETDKVEEWKAKYEEWKIKKQEAGAEAAGHPPRLKAYSDMAEDEERFRTDIEKIVDTGKMPLSIKASLIPVNRGRKHTYLSSSNFLHLYDFAVSLNGRYNYIDREDTVAPEQLAEEFEELSLEYQLSNINQAKSFGRYLDEIDCFYTDRPVDYEMIPEFTPAQMDLIAPMEHRRWLMEHQQMGWLEGSLYETAEVNPEPGVSEKNYRKALREQLRMHKLMMEGPLTEDRVRHHYDHLSVEDQGKDYKPFNSMLKLVRKFDGLRIYQLTEPEEEQTAPNPFDTARLKEITAAIDSAVDKGIQKLIDIIKG